MQSEQNNKTHEIRRRSANEKELSRLILKFIFKKSFTLAQSITLNYHLFPNKTPQNAWITSKTIKNEPVQPAAGPLVVAKKWKPTFCSQSLFLFTHKIAHFFKILTTKFGSCRNPVGKEFELQMMPNKSSTRCNKSKTVGLLERERWAISIPFCLITCLWEDGCFCGRNLWV